MQRTLSPLRQGHGATSDIVDAYHHGEDAEVQLRQCILGRGISDPAMVECEVDRLRLLAEDPQNDSEPLARAWVMALKAFQDAIYRAVAADRGHTYRAMKALDHLPRPDSVPLQRYQDMLRPYHIPTRRVGTRKIPDIKEDLLLVDVVTHDKHPITMADFSTTTVAQLGERVAKVRKVAPVSRIHFYMGNSSLEPTSRTLSHCGVRPGTVLFYDVKVMEENK